MTWDSFSERVDVDGGGEEGGGGGGGEEEKSWVKGWPRCEKERSNEDAGRRIFEK